MKLILFGATGMVGSGALREALADPGPGIRRRHKLYQAFMVLSAPLFPVVVRALPSVCTTSERLGRAMLRVVQGRAGRYILESADINRLGAA